MKRIIALLLAALAVCAVMCSCTGKTKESKTDGKLRIVTTIFPPYDFARQVAGDQADLTMLLPPGTESHHFDPTPQDMIKIQNADLFIYVGGESDKWVEEMLSSASKQPKKVISLMDCVDKLEEEIVEGMEAEEDDSDEVEYDEHVWTSPKNAVTITKTLSTAIKELDPAHESVYEKRTNTYCKQLSALDDSLRRIVDNGSRKLMVFGDRFPFKYFADAYGLKYYAAFPGCSGETEPSAATVAFLIDKVRSEKIPVVFTIEFSGGKIADTICESTGAKKLQLHSCHNVTQEEFDGGVTYLELMQQNALNLKEALA